MIPIVSGLSNEIDLWCKVIEEAHLCCRVAVKNESGLCRQVLEEERTPMYCKKSDMSGDAVEGDSWGRRHCLNEARFVH